MTLTKQKLVCKLQEAVGIPKPKSQKHIDMVIKIMMTALENGEHLLISGFGKWEVKKKRARRGRNPQTGADLTIDSRKVIKFSSSSTLRRKLNEKDRITNDDDQPLS
jgi:integration host factor subunit alpha